MTEELETDFIALRKVQYADNAVIYSGLSPEYGRLGFMVRVAGGNRSFPDMELFRLLHVQFKTGKGELCWLVSVELIEDFGHLVQKYERYEAACWIASFCMLNVMPMLPHPHFANAVEVALRRLANVALVPDAILTGVCLAFVFEEGWLAYAIQGKDAAEQCRRILEMEAGNPAPLLSDECWKAQFGWCKEILLINDCHIP